MSVMLYISETMHHMIVIYGTFVWNDDISSHLFWFSWLLGGESVKNGPKSEKNMYCSVSYKPYIIWFSFMVHICKVIVSPSIFFDFFKILIFQVVSGLEGQKVAQNDKNVSIAPHISGTMHHMIVIYGTQV